MKCDGVRYTKVSQSLRLVEGGQASRKISARHVTTVTAAETSSVKMLEEECSEESVPDRLSAFVDSWW
jgi:hypothetical protein